MALRTVGARLMLDVSQYMSNLKRAGAATKDFAGQLDKSAKAGNLDAVADRAAVAGIALAGMAGYAVKAAADFDKAMSGVKAATHASAAEIGQLRKAALQAGKDTSYSATEAAKGITELSKAGVSTADVLGGGLKGALSLAAAGQLDVGEAAETAASAMTQFGLKGKDIPHIADLLAAGAGKAQGSVHDMGMALSQSGLVASQFGLSIEDSTGTLAAFASAGLIGSDAGTSFKTMLLALANPAEKTKDLMEDLGIQAYNAQGKFVGITNLAEQLKTKLGGLTQAQRDAALAQIFGTDAIRAANVLYREGGQGIDGWVKKVDEAGYASKTAADLTDNLAGDIERLKGSLETLAIESGSGANGGLRVLVKGLEDLVDRFGSVPSAVSGSMVVLSAIGGVVLLALAAFIKLRKGLAEAVIQLNMMGPAGEKAATGLTRVASAAGKAFAALAVLEVIGTIADHFGAAAANVDQLTSSLTNYANTGKVAGELSDIFGNNLKDLGKNAQAADAASHGFWGGLNDLTSSIPGVNSLVDTLNERIYGLSFNQATDNMTALDAALTDFMTTTGDATKSSELWNKVQSESGLSAEQLIALLPNAYKKVGELNQAQMDAEKSGKGMAAGQKAAAGAAGEVASATPGATEATKEYKTAADAAAGAARGQKAALSQLSDFMKAETDPVFAFIDAQKDLTKAQKDAKKAQEDLDKAIDKHGPKSKEAKAASDKLKTATRELANSAIDLQGKTGALGDTFNGKLSPSLVDTFKKAGLTDGQIKILTGQFKNAKKAADAYSGKYEAKASAPGAKQAKTDLDKAYNAANHFAGPYRATVSISGDKNVGQRLDRLRELQEQLKAGKNISVANAMSKKGFGYAGGGWTGPGQMMDVAGVVHADEFVIKKSSRRKIEAKAPGLLEEMNATGQAPGYALGGLVSWPYHTTAAMTRIPSKAEALSVVVGQFGNWPSSPGAQRGDSGVWRKVLALARSSGLPVHFGNGYRPGDPLWHGSGRADDLMGYNQDALANFFLQRQGQILEMIHRTSKRDYAYTRGRNKGSFNEPLMNAHRNHLHIAMKNGGTITEPVMGVGASGTTYSLGENYQPERVSPMWQTGGSGGGVTLNVNFSGPIGSRYELQTWLEGSIDDLRRKGKV